MVGASAFSDAVRAAFAYDEGVLRWRARHGTRGSVGQAAGSRTTEGYLRVKWNGKMYLAHRLVFALHHSWLPEEVDHINGDRSDNRIENLRAATKSLNQRNAKKRKDCSSGVKGVHWCARDKRWVATVRLGPTVAFQKYFRELPDAAAAVQNARAELHGEFARHD